MIILLSGKTNSGKDTAADWLAANYEAINLKFSRKLKDAAIELFGLREPGPGEDWTPKDREILIDFGAFVRQIDPWAIPRSALPSIGKANMRALVPVFSDWRLREEYNCLRNAYRISRIITVRIINLGNPDSPFKNNLTETDLDGFDMDYKVYADNGDIEGLQAELKKLADDVWLERRIYT